MTLPQSPTEIDPAAPPRRGVSMPGWLAVLIVLLVAGGFGYLGWRMLRSPPPVDLSQFDPNETGRRRPRFTFPVGPQPDRPNAVARPEPVEAVALQPDGSGTARTPAFAVRFTGGKKPNVIAMAPNGRPADRRPSCRPRPHFRRQRRRRPQNRRRHGRSVQTAPGDSSDQSQHAHHDRRPDQPARPLGQAPRRRRHRPSRRGIGRARRRPFRRRGDYKVAEATTVHATAEQVRAVLPPDQIEKIRPAR